MKKNVVLPALFGLVVLFLAAVIVKLAIPYIEVFKGTAERAVRAESPPPAPAPKSVAIVDEAKPEKPPAEITQRKGKPIPDSKRPEPRAEKPEPARAEPSGAKRDAELEARIAELYPLPDIPPLETIVGNWNEVPERAFPKGVTVNELIEFNLFHEGRAIGGRKVPAGAHVVPLELRGTTLVVAPDVASTMRAEIGVDETNFKELIRLRYDSFVEQRTADVMAMRAAEFERVRKTEAYEAELAAYNDGSDPRFDPMKESLRNAEAGTFELENTTEWRWLGRETIEGVEYEVGVAVFETESAFGVARTEIKALLRGGRVEKWINPTTNEPI